MHALRSRTGVVSTTVAAAVLLALPVVAAGEVPGVDQVLGGVTETAQGVVPVQVPVPVPALASKPQAAPPASAPAAPAPAASAPAAPRQSATAAAPRATSSSGRAAAHSASKSGSATGGDSAVRARAESDAPARASQDDSSDESAASEGASGVGDLPEDASAETLPFTGLQLALIVMAGLAALTGGVVLRRSAGTARR